MASRPATSHRSARSTDGSTDHASEQRKRSRRTEPPVPTAMGVATHRWLAHAAALLALSPLFALLGPAPAADAAEGEPCPNAPVRAGFSALLPDCRAYERVSPPGSPPELEVEKLGYTHGPYSEQRFAGSDTIFRPVFVAQSGSGFVYAAPDPPAGAVSSGEIVRAVRGSDGWHAEGLSPPQSTNSALSCPGGYPEMFAPELSEYVLADGWDQNEALKKTITELNCGRAEPPLVAGEPAGVQNLFLTEGAAGPYELLEGLADAPEGVVPASAWFEDASEDLSRVVFTENARLTAEAPAGLDLYDASADGALRLVTRLPDGAAVEGRIANSPQLELVKGEATETASSNHLEPRTEIYTHAMSSDGSHVYFQAGGDLYLRLHPERPQSALGEGGQCTEPEAACTIQIDAAQGEGEGGGGVFAWATADGQRVFFLDERRLTADATASSGKPDLYEYDLALPLGSRLRDLTTSTEAADVLGVLGVGGDGSFVYFAAEGTLTTTPSAAGATPVAGQPNLYLSHEGAITFIATLAPFVNEGEAGDSADWNPEHSRGGAIAQVTADGEYLAFNSQMPLTGYHNVSVAGEVQTEIFRYHAANNELVCVSCDPTGAPPIASAQLPLPMKVAPNYLVSAPRHDFQLRSLTEDGRLFFGTAQPLVPAAKSDVESVYEYEDGEPRLLSTGTSPALFYGASPNGSNVFVVTSQELPSSEADDEFAIYDVREDGGFPTAAPVTTCVKEECRGDVQVGGQGALPATTVAMASGNVLAVHQSAPPSASHPAESGYQAALKACHRDKSARARRACQDRARESHRQELLERALAACRAKHSRSARLSCQAKAHSKYPPPAISRHPK